MVKAKKEKAAVKKALAHDVKKKSVVKAVKAKEPKKAEAHAHKPPKAAAPARVKKAAVKTAAVKKKAAPAVAAPPLQELLTPPLEQAPAAPVAQPVQAPVIPHPPAPKEVKHHPVKEAVAHPQKTEVVPPPQVKKEVKPSTPVKEAPAPVAPPAAPALAVPAGKTLELELPITLKDLAIKLQEKPSVIIKGLMGMGVMAGINQLLDEQTVSKVCQKYGCVLTKAPGQEEQLLRSHEEPDDPHTLKPRAPIVTFMGHVDHGKTSLLDAIRKTKVVDSEHGGITQHIGAYRVKFAEGEITFLDTPGHEAFTAMRARGASVTDIVVLVVAADDGIMPQTEEAIDHARAAGVPIIVAMNKIDKQQANVDRLKKQLSTHDLAAEDWGGKTITVPVSAKSGQGIDTLLEMILLEAQMLELKANPSRQAKGVVLEAKMSKGRGPVATLLVQNGTLHLNENIVVGPYFGKLRAMFDAFGHAITHAGPSVPIEILGLGGVPQAGEQFYVIEDEKKARELVELRQEKEKLQQAKTAKKISLEDLYAQIKEGVIKELKLIVKADVQGSLEAIKDTLDKLNVSEIKLEFIHQGVGTINSSDVILAVASNALILGFNVTADDRAKEMSEKEGVEIKTYNIIYELANDIKAAIEGMLEPKTKKIFVGRAEVRKVFKLSRSGLVAGCFVTKGRFTRQLMVTLVRNGETVFDGKLSSLKRFKDDVKEVAEGFECGMTFAGYEAFKEGDVVEGYDIEKIARTL